MGMFDNIECNHPIPLPLEVIDIVPDIYEQEIQTKCLDCLMDLYILDEDGVLHKDDKKYEWRDDDSHFLKGYLEVVERKIIETHFHGIINFYIYDRILDSEDKNKGIDISLDYIAKFTSGKLDFIELKNYTIEDASEHIKRTNEFFKNLEVYNNKWFNKYFLRTKPVSFIRKKVHRFFYNLHNLTGKLHTFAIKYL
jgi:hypothetical protein